MAEESRIPAKPIAIIGAMDVETNVLESLMSHRDIEHIGAYRFVEGVLAGRRVILGRSFIGMTNAAAVAAILVSRCNPLFVITEGTAGGHNPELHRGDIVLGETVKHIHFISTRRRAVGEGSRQEDWIFSGPEMVFDNNTLEERNELPGDSRLLDIAVKVPYNGGQIVRGVIGSGDLWDREADRILMLHNTMGTDCEDMESFAVAQVCHQLGVPSLSIRVISNSELHPEEEYVRTLGETCQSFVADFISSVPRDFM